MIEDDLTYFRRRVDAELRQAGRATKPEVVRAHVQLATAYRERVAAAEPAPGANYA